MPKKARCSLFLAAIMLASPLWPAKVAAFVQATPGGNAGNESKTSDTGKKANKGAKKGHKGGKKSKKSSADSSTTPAPK